MRSLDRLQPLGLVVMRLVLGVIMIVHGSHKGFGGISQYVQMARSFGLPGWLAYLSVAVEFFGGIFIILGLLTRCAALAITIDLAIAIGKVNWKNGLLGEHGYQLPLALAAIAFGLIFFGAGPIAFDSLRGGGKLSGRN